MKSRKNSFEAKILSLIPEGFETVDVIAHELWKESEGGLSVNDSWKMCRGVSIEDAMSDMRGRWEVFKLNYHSKARVSDIEDVGWEEAMNLEVDGIPFLEIRRLRA